MKVVINECYGGFSLSAEAVKYIAQLDGKECFFFTDVFSQGSNQKYTPATIEKASNDWAFFAFSIPNPNEVLTTIKDWSGMSLKEREKSNKLYNSFSLSNRDVKRDDPILVKCIEKLGNKADGKLAKLKIVEIPDGTEYTIEEYDGVEHIAEVHRTWE